MWSNTVLSEGTCENSQSSDTFEEQPEVQWELKNIGLLVRGKKCSFGNFWGVHPQNVHSVWICCLLYGTEPTKT